MGGRGWGYRILLVGIGLDIGAIIGTCLAELDAVGLI